MAGDSPRRFVPRGQAEAFRGFVRQRVEGGPEEFVAQLRADSGIAPCPTQGAKGRYPADEGRRNDRARRRCRGTCRVEGSCGC